MYSKKSKLDDREETEYYSIENVMGNVRKKVNNFKENVMGDVRKKVNNFNVGSGDLHKIISLSSLHELR